MYKKIICILVMTLFIASIAIPISALNENNKPLTIGADVPVWQVGDTWTYEMSLYLAASPNVTDDMVAEVNGELILEVEDDVGDNYKLKGIMKPMKGTVDLPGNMDLRITRLSSYSSNLEVQKTDLAILNYESMMKGMVHFTIGPIPLPIPIQMQSYRQTEFNPALNLIPFPLSDGKSGTIGDFTVTEQAEVSMFWGLIPISQEVDLQWPIAEQDYTCTLESITVPAGTFDVYHIVAEHHWGEHGVDWFYSYYSEDVGNVVKSSLNIDFGDTELTYYSMEMELISTSFEL